MNQTKLKYQLAFSFLVLGILISCNKENPEKKYSIKKGEFKASITETGELQSVNSVDVIPPRYNYYGNLSVVDLVEHGKQVKKGEIVAKLGAANLMSYIDERKRRAESEQANLNKLISRQENSENGMEAEMKTAQANFDMKKLELEKFQFESEKKKELKALEFEQAEINLEKIIKNIALRKKISQFELNIQKIRFLQLQDNINEAYEAEKDLVLFAPVDGIVQVGRNMETGKMLKPGDRVYNPYPVISLPDISKMKVKSRINETDISKIKLHQKVIIRLEAYPDIPFEGEIVEISRLCYRYNNNSSIKVFDVTITIDNDESRLKPGMTVNCEYVYADYNDVFYVENECIYRDESGYYIYKKTGTGYEKQKVQTGSQNNTYTQLIGNFKEGTDLVPISEINDLTDKKE